MSAQRTIPQPRTETRPATGSTSARRVVVGTDDSYWGRMALAWAIDHAWRRFAELRVYAAPASEHRDPLDFGGIGALLRQHPTLPVRVRSTTDPVAALVTASAGGELVVLGWRDRWHQGLGLGPTVLPVLARSRCDVLVARGQAEAVRGAHRTVTVLLGGPDDDRAVTAAATLARWHQSRLRIELATSPPNPALVPQPPEDLASVLERAGALAARTAPTVPVVPRLVHATPPDLIGDLHGTDVLVLAGGHRGALTAHARLALHHSPCPVLVTR